MLYCEELFFESLGETMVELAEERSAAAWKIKNLKDYDGRLERAARRFDEISRERPEPALVIYASALKKSGRSEDEIRGMVREFHETFEDEEEPLTITRASAIMSVEGDGWFFGDENLRVLTGRLLGQFQHRVAQYNYVDESEVLKRWADGYDTRPHAEALALHLDIPAPIVGEMLEDLGREGFTDFPEPPSEPEENEGV